MRKIWRKVSLSSPLSRIENLEKVARRKLYVALSVSNVVISFEEDRTITSWCACGRPRPINIGIKSASNRVLETVSSVAVARQGAQCGARLHRWIKVRSAGHDIPRSTRSMKVGTRLRPPPRGNVLVTCKNSQPGRIPRISPPPNIYTFDRFDHPSPRTDTRNLGKTAVPTPYRFLKRNVVPDNNVSIFLNFILLSFLSRISYQRDICTFHDICTLKIP